MVAGTHNIKIEKGETWGRTWTYKINTVAVDLSGFTGRMTIRDCIGGVQIASLTTENGGMSLNSSGEITLLINDTATTAITQNTGVYDLELISGAAAVTKLMKGEAIFFDEVTT